MAKVKKVANALIRWRTLAFGFTSCI